MNASLASGVGSVTNCVFTDLVVVQDGPCVDREGGTQLEGRGGGGFKIKEEEDDGEDQGGGRRGVVGGGVQYTVHFLRLNNYTCIYIVHVYTLYVEGCINTYRGEVYCRGGAGTEGQCLLVLLHVCITQYKHACMTQYKHA